MRRRVRIDVRRVRLVAAWLLGAVALAGGLAACGGSATPAENAEPAPAAADDSLPADVGEDAEPSSGEQAKAGKADAGKADADGADASSPVSVQSFQNALQAVIGDPALLEAIGHDSSSTKPVLISGKDLPAGLERAAAIRPIEVVPLTDKPGKSRILLFTRIELDEKRGTFKYKCEATGIFGSTRVAYEGGGWQLKSSQISHP